MELSTSKKIIFSILPTIIIAIVAFISAELVLRQKYNKISQITGIAEWELATSDNISYYWDKYHPVMGWTNLPGYKSNNKVPFRVSINNQGLRADKEYSMLPPGNVTRVIVLGDSFTFGEDVNDDETLPWYLNKLLSHAEVLNLGVHGYGLGEMVLRFEEESLKFNPDHVLLLLSLPSSIGRIPLSNFVHPKPTFSLANNKLTLANVPVPIASNQPWLVRNSYVAAWLMGRPKEALPPDNSDDLMTVTKLLLERLKDKCDSHGITLTVVTIAGPEWTNAMKIDAEFHDNISSLRDQVLQSNPNINIVDKIDFLKKIQRKDTPKTPVGTHWTGRENCMLADSIALSLSKLDADLTYSDSFKCIDPK